MQHKIFAGIKYSLLQNHSFAKFLVAVNITSTHIVLLLFKKFDNNIKLKCLNFRSCKFCYFPSKNMFIFTTQKLCHNKIFEIQ